MNNPCVFNGGRGLWWLEPRFRHIQQGSGLPAGVQTAPFRPRFPSYGFRVGVWGLDTSGHGRCVSRAKLMNLLIRRLWTVVYRNFFVVFLFFLFCSFAICINT